LLPPARYDFDYEDDDEDGHTGDPDVENRYYNAKALKDDEPRIALVEFFKIKSLPTSKDGDW
jgi:COP9 signalosome complex subunit 2